ncbi:hypothetical protein T4A_2385 [Trichinella pseudospiralis]|uniref:Uncharacterized protein n=1 Tax=Trichinella pseudospiralis TaxID=6337 RepID=A0A0V1E303_TRIPS|nr:hypothetical protein T4A_2385 [Trichinella pseudospiralis]
MFIPLRYYCDGKLGCSSGGKMYTHATTVQYLEIVKVMNVLEIITKYESIKELDAENECWYLYFEQHANHNCSQKRSWAKKCYRMHHNCKSFIISLVILVVKLFIWILHLSNTKIDFNVKSWNQKIVYGRARSRYKTGTGTAQCFLWNVQPAGTMLLHMIMMIYGKLWSLFCHYLLDEFFMKAILHGLTVLSTFYTANVTVEGMDYVVFVLLNPASMAVAALCKFKPEATPPGIA